MTGPLARSYAYDAAGNVTGDGVNGFLIDMTGRLRDASGAWGHTLSRVDGLGRRVQKMRYIPNAIPYREGTYVETFFAYDDAGHLLGEYDGAGNALQETVWLGETPVAVLKAGVLYYAHADHLDAPRVITDTQNRVVWRWDNADAFGVGLPNENPSGLGTFTYNLRFPGQFFDQETGLHYNYLRDSYDPRGGRYLQSDPIGVAGGLNLYAYVGGNPVSYVDPLGLYTEVIRWATDGSGSGAWGHISGNINGQNFSWSPGGWDSRASAADYIKRQVDGVHRDGQGMVLNLTPGEEAKLASCLRRERGSYNGVTNNCGNPWLSCLQKLGVVNSNDKARVLPADVIKIIGDSPRAIGQTSYSAPGNKSFDIAPIWPIVDSARRVLER